MSVTSSHPAIIPPIDPNNPWATAGRAPETSVAIHTARRLPVEPVTAETFAPFGVVLSPDGRHRLPVNTYGDRLDLFRADFETDQPIEWFIAEFRDRGTWHENPMSGREGARLLVTTHANLTLAHQQNPNPALAGLPLDLERRWYRAAGYDVSAVAA